MAFDGLRCTHCERLTSRLCSDCGNPVCGRCPATRKRPPHLRVVPEPEPIDVTHETWIDPPPPDGRPTKGKPR